MGTPLERTEDRPSVEADRLATLASHAILAYRQRLAEEDTFGRAIAETAEGRRATKILAGHQDAQAKLLAEGASAEERLSTRIAAIGQLAELLGPPHPFAEKCRAAGWLS
jgi:hypothetical protein